jgi:MFS family permease
VSRLSVRGDTDGPTEAVFIGGIFGLGIISLGVGFVDGEIPMIICRALTGIGEHRCLCVILADSRFSASSMTIPSALTLLVNAFPDPHQQARAISMFGGCGGVASSGCMYMINYGESNGVFT